MYIKDPVGLSVYLATMLQQAVEDLYRLNPDPGPDPQRMYARFLGWTAPRMRITPKQSRHRPRRPVTDAGSRCAA